MTLNEILRQIEETNQLLVKNSDLYYKDLTPSMSDESFDKEIVKLRGLVDDLKKIHGQHVPTILDKVGSDLTGHLKEVKHLRPMISIRTEVDTSDKPIKEFIARCEKLLGRKDIKYVAEPKFDGLAISLRYNPVGQFLEAVTRGDGETGEDVTSAITHVQGVPLELNSLLHGTDEIRGEVMLLKSHFESANQLRIIDGDKPFINCRNAAAGILRRKTPDKRFLGLMVFIPYSVYGHKELITQSDALTLLSSIPIESLKDFKRYERCNGDALERAYQEYKQIRDKLDFEIDGVVYKVDSFTYQEKLGISGREPRWSIAHKLPAEVAETILESISVQVGPSGRLTPVARLTPIFVGGTTIANVTLSNMFQIRSKGVRVGDLVRLQRAGDVIPEIIGVSPKNKRSSYVPNFWMPKNCPVCNGRVVRKPGESNHYCIASYSCPAQRAGMLARACSRELLDIDGFGDKIAENMILNGMLKVSDIFDLRMSDMSDIDVGDAHGQKLLRNISRVARTPMGLDMFLRLIGIAELGASASKKIAAYVGDFETFVKFDPEVLRAYGVNRRVIANIKEFHKTPEAQKDAFLLHSKLIIVNYEKNVDGCLAGKTIVVTGSSPNVPREPFKKKVEELGGKISGSVSKNTTYVVYGDGSGDKLEKAGKLGIEKLTYEQFIELYLKSVEGSW